MSAVCARRRRLPPYGAERLAERERGITPDLLIVSMDNWKYGLGRARVVIPKDLDLAAVDFCFAAGLDVWVCFDERADQFRVLDVARELHRMLAASIFLLNLFEPGRSVFAKSHIHGWELDGT